MILSPGSLHPLLASSSGVIGLLSVLSVCFYAFSAWGRSHAWRCLWLGWLLQGAAILIDVGAWWLGSERGVHFGFAAALSTTLWLVLAVYGVESRLVAITPRVRRVLALLAMGTVAVLWVFPSVWRIQVVSAGFALHLLLGLAAYGLMGVAVLHAVLLGRTEHRLRSRSEQPLAPQSAPDLPLMQLERLTFGFVRAAWVALTLALVCGVWFAPVWVWSHKTVFVVLSWVVLTGLVLGRQLLGWRGPYARRLIHVSAAFLLLAYVGSRFVFEVLLHRTPNG
jgi:ABC-type uncharacterized transport system permease subunit